MNPLRIFARSMALAAVFVCMFSVSASVTKGALASSFKSPEYIDPMGLDVLYDKPAKIVEEEKEASPDIPEEASEPEPEVEEEVYEEEYIGEPVVYTEEVYNPAPDIHDGGYAGSPGDFQTAGVVYGDDGTRYTWYSEQVLPGDGLDIPGRYTDEEGFVRDESDNIAVASSDYEKGTEVDTPFGPGVVYDTGCASGTVDIYVGW